MAQSIMDRAASLLPGHPVKRPALPKALASGYEFASIPICLGVLEKNWFILETRVKQRLAISL